MDKANPVSDTTSPCAPSPCVPCAGEANPWWPKPPWPKPASCAGWQQRSIRFVAEGDMQKPKNWQILMYNGMHMATLHPAHDEGDMQINRAAHLTRGYGHALQVICGGVLVGLLGFFAVLGHTCQACTIIRRLTCLGPKLKPCAGETVHRRNRAPAQAEAGETVRPMTTACSASAVR